MKNFLKSLAALAMFAWSISAFGQAATPQAVTLGVSTVVANTTSNINAVLDVRRQDKVALQLSFTPALTNATTVTVTLDQSVDGVNWATQPEFSWAYLSANTAAEVIATTNLTVNGYSFIRVKTIGAASGSGVTLNSLKYAIKNPPRE